MCSGTLTGDSAGLVCSLLLWASLMVNVDATDGAGGVGSGMDTLAGDTTIVVVEVVEVAVGVVVGVKCDGFVAVADGSSRSCSEARNRF